MRITYLFILLNIFVFSGCKEHNLHLTKIEGKQIAITDSIEANKEIDAYIKPFRDRIERDLDSVLAYSVDTYSKNDGEYNSAVGNFMADAVFSESNPIFKSRTGKDIDVVLLNYGGIRSILSKGNVTKRTAFGLMPFENSIVVTALKGVQMDSMINYLSRAKKAHPISGLKIKLDKNYKILEAKVNGENIENDRTYYVATNDYLYNGGDNMSFFKTNDSLYILDYKIRNALIDKFIKLDTINPVIDDRFTQIK
ncbi:5'-nucleotidase C-terminal domain-containing protein [Algibacter sp. L1A34]|uniref:5'-nucleotidase C-terminal domain-containing protein n=1 Tax=Algibacter sp. L1A34 TaxID=2686365 RepID=UPI00131D1561|nr:5'-nucleotidase [Algibacter sp. L1A34]